MAAKKRGGQLVFKEFLDKGTEVDGFEALVNQYEQHLLSTTDDIAAILDKNLTPGIDKMAQWGNASTEFDTNVPMHKKMLDQLGTWASAQQGGDMSVTFAKVQKLMSECVPFFAKNNDLDHTEFNKVSFKLRGIYESLLRIETRLQGDKTRKVRADKVIAYSVSSPTLNVGSVEGSGREVPTTLKVKDLRNLIEDIRQLMIISLAMGRLDTSVYGDNFTIGEMNKLLIDEVNSWSQSDLEAIKDTQVDVVRGKGTMNAEWLSSKDNKGKKASLEKRLGGTAARKLLTPINKKQSNFDKTFGSIDWSRIKGSNTIDEELHKQTVALLQGKRAKPHKAKAKVKRGVKTSPKARAIKAKALKAKRANAGKRYAMAALATIKLKQKEKGAGGKSDNKINYSQLRGAINKRLPAEVRRNMGRPALINRTGRFSNSAFVSSIRDTATGISMEYSYMTSPYETFENTGKRIWPTGYNPKPLIAKSIRNLAMGLTKQNLASLRRT